MDKHNFEDSSWFTIAEAASEHYKSYVNSSFGDSTKLSLAKNEIDQALLLFNTGTEPKDTICYLKEYCLADKNFLFGYAGEIYANFDKEKSLEYFKLFQFYKFNEWITDISISEDKEKNYFNDKRYEGVTAYKFRACSPHLFADLANNEITLSRPHCMNDPFDSLYSIWSEEDNLTNVLTDKKHISMFKKSFDYYRFCSFCIDDDAENTILGNILMWSHYADEHRGICIKYKLKGNCINTDCSDDIDDVRPQALLHRINYKKVEPLSLQEKSIKIGLAFAHKHPCWEYEKEARLISYDATKEGDRYTIPYNEGISIEAIYFGLNCSKDDKTIIKRILDDKNIEYYDMKCNYGDVYKMDIKSEK